MNDVAILVEGLSKRYRIGQRKGYLTMRESLTSSWRNALNLFSFSTRAQTGTKNANNYIWALKDVSFEVKRGEIVGIIGKNGTGKTTLLKILSRITEPTEGCAEIHGRVASLLEVGTGFHPELTGRENISLNGAILGMKKAEIERKFDEIVAFAEIEKFIDTPVKRYSSGMYVRLAFAVAAHLEPEILLVDEVLAVGDAAFQKKCLGKMGDVAKEGRTVLFVSHNMASIIRLCSRALLFSEGHVRFDGPTRSVVTAYLADGATTSGARVWHDQASSPGDDKIRLRAVRIIDAAGNISPNVDVQQPFQIAIEYLIIEKLPPMRIVFTLSTGDGADIFTSTDISDPAWAVQSRPPGRYVSRCTIPANLLNSGNHVLRVGADIPFREVLFVCDNALAFEVVETGGVSGRFTEKWSGVICPQLSWSVLQLNGV